MNTFCSRLIRHQRRVLPVASMVFLIAGCSSGNETNSAPQLQSAQEVAIGSTPEVQNSQALTNKEIAPELQRAQDAMTDLGQRLKTALTETMQAEGAVGAVDFCHREAPLIAAEVAKQHGVAVGRTAVRHRSRVNAPTAWQQAVLQRFVEQSANVPPQALMFSERTDATLRVAKGIPTHATCLACHGSDIAEPVRAAIVERYPEDTATGFAEGELRGMFWAEVPLEVTQVQP